jgi:hypothetical protein
VHLGLTFPEFDAPEIRSEQINAMVKPSNSGSYFPVVSRSISRSLRAFSEKTSRGEAPLLRPKVALQIEWTNVRSTMVREG